MINENQFISLAREIVDTHIPNEIAAFEIEASDIYYDILNGINPMKQKKKSGEHIRKEAGTSVVVVMEFIVLLWATYEALEKFVNKFRSTIKKQNSLSSRKKLEEELTMTWENTLIDAGMEQSKAHKIASNYSEHLMSILNSEIRDELMS